MAHLSSRDTCKFQHRALVAIKEAGLELCSLVVLLNACLLAAGAADFEHGVDLQHRTVTLALRDVVVAGVAAAKVRPDQPISFLSLSWNCNSVNSIPLAYGRGNSTGRRWHGK